MSEHTHTYTPFPAFTKTFTRTPNITLNSSLEQTLAQCTINDCFSLTQLTKQIKVFAMTVVSTSDVITQCLHRPISIFWLLGDLREYKCTQHVLLSSSEFLDLTWGCNTGLNTLNGQAELWKRSSTSSVTILSHPFTICHPFHTITFHIW